MHSWQLNPISRKSNRGTAWNKVEKRNYRVAFAWEIPHPTSQKGWRVLFNSTELSDILDYQIHAKIIRLKYATIILFSNQRSLRNSFFFFSASTSCEFQIFMQVFLDYWMANKRNFAVYVYICMRACIWGLYTRTRTSVTVIHACMQWVWNNFRWDWCVTKMVERDVSVVINVCYVLEDFIHCEMLFLCWITYQS